MLELDLQMVGEIQKAVRAGEWPREASVRLGSTRKEFLAWWEAGEGAIDAPPGTSLTEHQRICGRLVTVVRVAESERERELQEKCERAAADPKQKGAWTAYMTLLERRFPDRWRKREMERKAPDRFDPDAEMRRLSEKKGEDEHGDARRLLGG